MAEKYLTLEASERGIFTRVANLLKVIIIEFESDFEIIDKIGETKF